MKFKEFSVDEKIDLIESIELDRRKTKRGVLKAVQSIAIEFAQYRKATKPIILESTEHNDSDCLARCPRCKNIVTFITKQDDKKPALVSEYYIKNPFCEKCGQNIDFSGFAIKPTNNEQYDEELPF